MPIEILMPALSPTMTEGNLARWLKKEGDTIEAGDILAEIETDKATMEVEAVDEGVLGTIIIGDKTENVAVNSVIALLLEEGEDKSALDDYKIEEKVDEKPKEEKKVEPKAQKIEPKQQNNVVDVQNNDSDIKASPLAKRIAGQNNVDLGQIAGSGPRGRVVRDDVITNLAKGSKKDQVILRDANDYQVVENSNIRKIIAKKLVETKQNVPHFYLSISLNLDKLLDARAQLNKLASVIDGRPAFKVSVNDLFIKACALALKKVPHANSSWNDDGVILYNNVDVSVAVAIDGGLITPIVKNADQKTPAQISLEVKELAKKARENRLTPEEFQGGGFSISNLGMYGIEQFNAIINPPQSCILAVGASKKETIVTDNDEIIIANIAKVTLSCDHRVVDGAVGAQFLNILKDYIENPVSLIF